MAIKESNITITVLDLNNSILFYQSIGLILKSRWGNHYAQLAAPGVVIGLHQSGQANLKDNSSNVSIGFIPNDFDEAKSLLKKLLIEVTERHEEGGAISTIY